MAVFNFFQKTRNFYLSPQACVAYTYVDGRQADGIMNNSLPRSKLNAPKSIAFHSQAWPFLLRISRRCFTALASSSRTETVSSQWMHASVMLTPYFKALGPSLGTFWLPATY